MLKYQVSYKKPKKKGYACHKAVFYKIEDAIFWEEHVKNFFNLRGVGELKKHNNKINNRVLISYRRYT